MKFWRYRRQKIPQRRRIVNRYPLMTRRPKMINAPKPKAAPKVPATTRKSRREARSARASQPTSAHSVSTPRNAERRVYKRSIEFTKKVKRARTERDAVMTKVRQFRRQAEQSVALQEALNSSHSAGTAVASNVIANRTSSNALAIEDSGLTEERIRESVGRQLAAARAETSEANSE